MWLPWGWVATQGNPYTNRDSAECMNLLWFDLERFSIASTHCVHPLRLGSGQASTGSGRTETLPQRGKPARAEPFDFAQDRLVEA